MDKSCRRILKILAALMGCVLLFAACGQKDDPAQPSPTGGEGFSFLASGGGAGLDLAVERSDFFDVAKELEGSNENSTSDDGKFLCMQFYQGEPVQLWASAPYRAVGGLCVTVYMYSQDGTRETCIEQIDRFSGQCIAFRDSQGYCYSVAPGENNSITKLDSTGKTLYTAKLAGDRGQAAEICEMADGRLAVLVNKDIGSRDYGIVLMDDNGKLTDVDLQEWSADKLCYIGVAEDGLLLMEGDRLYRIPLSQGKPELLFSFTQTAYTVQEQVWGIGNQLAFRLDEAGRLEMLRSDRQGAAVCETLSLVPRDGSKQEVVLRGARILSAAWLKEQVQRFNSSSDRYHVVLECPEEWEDRDDYIARTSVELAAGKGPDILMGNLAESPGSLIEKGMLADLAPLMAQSGMKEDDYFPIAFDLWRTGDSIYSICCSSSFRERTVSTAVLGNAEYPRIEDLADALLAYQETAVYDGYYYAGDILRELLGGSETLWGMVDWEKGTCDFGGELFRKLLEAAKRYGYDGRNKYPAICDDRCITGLSDIYHFPTLEAMRAEGYVPVGQLFDDGSHPVKMFALPDFYAVNASSASKEGAWEFLQFLLGVEAQESLMEIELFDSMPVKKSVFRAAAEEEILNGPIGDYFYQGKRMEDPLPREKAEAAAALLENVRALPYRTEAILEIILEEAQEYFDGVKEIPQVVDAIENRVGLYLEERK